MPNYRMQKVNEDVKRAISDIIRNEIRDPQVPDLCSVLRVDVSKDLSFAKVYVTVMGDQDGRTKLAEKSLNRAAGFIKHKLSEVMQTRSVPTLKFVGDDSIQYSIDIAKKIEKLHENEKK